MIQLTRPCPITDLKEYTVLVDNAKETVSIKDAFYQCVYTQAFGYTWCIGLSMDNPPLIFVITPDGELETLGFTPHLCGPVVRMGVDADDIHLVVRSPEGDELYYRVCRETLSFQDPRGETITKDHVDLLYA